MGTYTCTMSLLYIYTQALLCDMLMHIYTMPILCYVQIAALCHEHMRQLHTAIIFCPYDSGPETFTYVCFPYNPMDSTKLEISTLLNYKSCLCISNSYKYSFVCHHIQQCLGIILFIYYMLAMTCLSSVYIPLEQFYLGLAE